jgi:transferase family protein
LHLPKGRAAELKKAASPPDGTWISTYDAITAISWRVFTRLRAPLYKPDPKSKPFWGEAVAMTKRLSGPPVPERLQGNIFIPVVSPLTPQVPRPTVEEVISSAPLWQLARYSRQMTESASEEWLMAALQGVAPVKNKADLSVKVSSFPPMAMVYTDWRPATVCEYDFGFGRPRAYRGHWDSAEENIFIVLPPRNGPAGEDEGVELQVSFEKELVEELVADAEFVRYFEFRGVDIEAVRDG